LKPDQDAELSRERLARHFGAGQVLVHHDTPALAVLSIHSGRVKLTRTTYAGHEVLVGLRGPGQLLGVREVLCKTPYQLSAETMEPSIVCSVPRESFLEAVRGCSDLAMRLLAELAQDYLLTEEQLVTRSHASVAERTARLLLTWTHHGILTTGSGDESCISMSRDEMALLVGTTRETLSRTLASLSSRGAIRLESGGIRILKRSLLQNLTR
jgi:CRP/FNR family transcriptional regulator